MFGWRCRACRAKDEEIARHIALEKDLLDRIGSVKPPVPKAHPQVTVTPKAEEQIAIERKAKNLEDRSEAVVPAFAGDLLRHGHIVSIAQIKARTDLNREARNG